MKRYNKSYHGSKYNTRIYRRTIMIVTFLLLSAAALGLFCYGKSGGFQKKWIKEYLKNLSYVFEESAPSLIIEKEKTGELFETVYQYPFDFNGDNEDENIRVSFKNQGETIQAVIKAENCEAVFVDLENTNENQKVFTVTGINVKGKTALAAIESVYAPGGGKGYLKCHVWRYENGSFVKNSEIIYSGVIGVRNYMVEGIIENRAADDTFYYNVEENQNGYIYERSRAIADMKDFGIKLPFETVGRFQVSYKRWVTGIFNVIME